MVRLMGVLTAAVLVGAGPARAEFLVALTTSNQLVTFDSATPGLANVVPITGTSSLVGIDYRPTTRELFGLSLTDGLVVLDPATGQATVRAALTAAPASSFTGLSGGVYGVDFNPVPDLLGNPSFRVVSDSGQNLRIDANTGQVIEDSPVTGGVVAGAAYTNNDVDPATGTTLYALDPATDTLLRGTNPNAGTYVTVGPLGVLASALNGFDVSGSGVAFVALNPISFGFPFGPAQTGAALYTADLGTGQLTFVGDIGDGLEVTGLAALPAQAAVVPAPPGLLAALLAGPLLRLTRRR